MKELTIGQKAQRYDEAIERAKKWYNKTEPDSYTCIVESIFPELKESEDEKIRKELISLFEDNRDGISHRYTGSDCERYITWLEKQGEQKFADKVEPKFHEGDWVNGYYTNYKVLSVNNNGYLVEDVDGNKINILFENEKFHHLFTIADAKDGDVLAYNDGSLAIFHYRLNGLNAGLYMSHVLLTDKIEFKQTCAIGNSHPATKEQRDTLEKAITNAGYRWDKEKLKLEKI